MNELGALKRVFGISLRDDDQINDLICWHFAYPCRFSDAWFIHNFEAWIEEYRDYGLRIRNSMFFRFCFGANLRDYLRWYERHSEDMDDEAPEKYWLLQFLGESRASIRGWILDYGNRDDETVEKEVEAMEGALNRYFMRAMTTMEADD